MNPACTLTGGSHSTRKTQELEKGGLTEEKDGEKPIDSLKTA